MSIFSLPVETLQEIVKQARTISMRALLNLSPSIDTLRPEMASRDMQGPEFFLIDVHHSRFRSSLSHLEALATSRTPWSRFARTLEIRRAAPSVDMDAEDWWEPDVRQDNSPEGRELERLLRPALTALPNVQTVRWAPRDCDARSAVKIIVDALISYPLLDYFQLTVYRSGFEGALDRLSGLRQLHLTTGCFDCLATSVAPIAQALANSPELTSLHLRSHVGTYSPTPSLHDIFRKLSATKLLHLTELDLKEYSLRLDSTILPHLRSLKTLSLRRIVTKDSPQYSGPSDEAQAPAVLGSTLQEIWDTLNRERIHLTQIATDVIEEGLLNYLASYTGLEQLAIDFAGGATEEESNRRAEVFFECALPKHTHSLVNLTCPGSFQGRWSFGKRTMGVILQLRKLESLCMSVDINETPSPSEDHIVHQFLGLIPELPVLRHLDIRSANDEFFRNDWCGTTMMSCRAAADVEIDNAVRTFKASTPNL
ncbi:hypothetical protein FB451DRAFT_1173610 [Mycena latifolia]|nr:hypothetical protein FB451DRAFT_1173610 [Mycena latifolia]